MHFELKQETNEVIYQVIYQAENYHDILEKMLSSVSNYFNYYNAVLPKIILQSGQSKLVNASDLQVVNQLNTLVRLFRSLKSVGMRKQTK